MTELVFGVDMTQDPWNQNHVYGRYTGSDHGTVLEGVELMMSGGIRENYTLAPLASTVNGEQYYVCITRVERNFRLTQMRLAFDPDDDSVMLIKERPIQTEGAGLLTKFSHIQFDTNQVPWHDFRVVFWSAVDLHWTRVFDLLSLSTNKHVPTGVLDFKYDSRRNGWVNHPAVPVPAAVAKSYDGTFRTRIEISIQEICSQSASSVSELMVPIPDQKGMRLRYVAIVLKDSGVKAVNVSINEGRIFQQVFVFPAEMGLIFPAFQFSSSKLTNAEKQALLQKPVYDHYKPRYDAFFERFRASRCLAFLMCLHPRLGEEAGTSGISPDIILKVAKLIE